MPLAGGLGLRLRSVAKAIRQIQRVNTVSQETSKPSSNTMWGGRFSSTPSALMEAINASIGFDQRLAAQDIQGSIAHSAMLARQGIITDEDRAAIHSGLQRVLGEIESGAFVFSTALE